MVTIILDEHSIINVAVHSLFSVRAVAEDDLFVRYHSGAVYIVVCSSIFAGLTFVGNGIMEGLVAIGVVKQDSCKADYDSSTRLNVCDYKRTTNSFNNDLGNLQRGEN